MTEVHNPRFSNSYDVFIRGQEIMSGAQVRSRSLSHYLIHERSFPLFYTLFCPPRYFTVLSAEIMAPESSALKPKP